nr:hypothetical protein [Tanacetum cinerariifolium]
MLHGLSILLYDAYGPIGPICTARHGGTTFTDYIPGPEAPPSPDYIPGPEYPEYLPPADNVLPAEEQPLPTAVSPTAESPGYITESEPEMEPAEEDGDDEKSKEDSIEYLTSGGYDDADDDGDDCRRMMLMTRRRRSPQTDSDKTKPFEEGETAVTPPPFGYCVATRISVQPHILMPFRSESEVERLLAIPTPPLSLVSPTSYPLPPFLMPLPIFTPLPTSSFLLPLSLPSTFGSESIPEVDIPFRKRARFTTPTGGYEVGKSSVAAARQIRPALTIADRRRSIPEADIPFRKRARFTTPTGGYEVGKSSVAAARQIRPALTIADRRRVDDRLIGRLRRERRYFRTLSTTYAHEVAHSRIAMENFKENDDRQVLPKGRNQEAYTLQGVALTWWNSHVKTVTLKDAQALPWKTLKKMMTDKYYPRGEIKKLKTEMVEKYIGGVPDTIHDSVKATKPKTMQEAIEFATELMDKRIRDAVENKRKFEGTSGNNQNQPH